jgi:opacity protein-like surface antigen
MCTSFIGVGNSMSKKKVLLSSAAVIAMTSSAWAAQGDTYLSLFGGYSTLADVELSHTYMKNSYSKIEDFVQRNRLGYLFTTISLTTASGFTPTKVADGYVVIGTMKGTYKLDHTRQFSGDVGSDGWVLGAAMGVELLGGLRGEAEMAFRRFDLNEGATLDVSNLYRRRNRYDGYYSYQIGIQLGTRSDTFTGVKETGTFVSSIHAVDFTGTHYVADAPATVDGELTSFSLMANLWYDFPLGDSGLKPFIGAGIGIANLTLNYDFRANAAIPQYRFDNLGTITNTTASGTTKITSTLTTSTAMVTPTTNFKDDDAVFAYQFGAGIGYEFDNGVMLAAQYRYFATTDADFGDISDNVESSDIIFSLTLPFGGR